MTDVKKPQMHSYGIDERNFYEFGGFGCELGNENLLQCFCCSFCPLSDNFIFSVCSATGFSSEFW